MNLPKFSVKNDIDAQHYVTVKLNKFGDKKPNDYGGNTYWGNCHVDGVEHMWFMSDNIHDNILKEGFKEGDTFCVMKWKAGAKMGYNYLACDDIQITNSTPMKKDGSTPVNDDGVITQNDLPPEAKTEDKPDWDKIAEGKVRHGICVAYIESGKSKLTPALASDINEWVDFVMDKNTNQ
jgi:hypothetical protein